MKTATEHDLSEGGQTGNPPVTAVPLVAFHPGRKGGGNALRKAGGAKESDFGARVDVIVTYEVFTTFSLLHFGKNNSEGTIIYTGSEDESISLERSVLVETVESISDGFQEPTLSLVLENETFTWIGLDDEFILITLHNGIHTLVGRKAGTGLKLLTTRHPVKLI